MSTNIEVMVGKVIVESKFNWVIDNFSQRGNHLIKSPIFTITDNSSIHKWYLQLYPKGDTEESKDYLSIYLVARSPHTPAVNATLQILSIKGSCFNSFTIINKICCPNEWGSRKFVSREFILDPTNNILNDDKITIVCEIHLNDDAEKKAIEQSKLEKEKKVEAENVLQRLAEIDKYEALIDNDKFSDISLISEGKAVKVHKCILAKSSPVFAAMFDADMKEKQNNTVEIEDIEHDILLEIIRFAYAGKVNNIDTIAGELAAAADKYAMDGLKEMCERTMLKNLSKDNVLLCLALADKHRMDKLKEMGITFVVDNAVDVTNKPEFKLLPSILLGDICQALVLKNVK